MCEFCITHGEGKKWYEVMHHYSRELLAQDNRRQLMISLYTNVERELAQLDRLAAVKKRLPPAYRFVRNMATRRMKRKHFGQVVPREDAEMIIDMVQSITRLPCMCRKATRGTADARYCLAIGIDQDGILGDYPELKNCLETLTPEAAKGLIRQFDDEGLIHSIWTFITPYIGGICNCDGDCLAYRTQISSDLMQIMFRAEYVAAIDGTLCAGCRQCQRLCQFGAIEYSSLDSQNRINTLKCYGCGVCRSVCNTNAIVLHPRQGIPEAASLW